MWNRVFRQHKDEEKGSVQELWHERDLNSWCLFPTWLPFHHKRNRLVQLPFTSPVVSNTPFYHSKIFLTQLTARFHLCRKCYINRHYQCINNINNIPWSSMWGSTSGTGHRIFLISWKQMQKVQNYLKKVRSGKYRFLLFHCIFLETTSNLNTHLSLVFWLLPYRWDFYTKTELWHLWLNLVVVQPTARKQHSFKVTATVANCLNC